MHRLRLACGCCSRPAFPRGRASSSGRPYRGPDVHHLAARSWRSRFKAACADLPVERARFPRRPPQVGVRCFANSRTARRKGESPQLQPVRPGSKGHNEVPNGREEGCGPSRIDCASASRLWRSGVYHSGGWASSVRRVRVRRFCPCVSGHSALESKHGDSSRTQGKRASGA